MFLNQTWSLWLCHNHIWVPGDPIHTNHATQRPRYLLYPILQKRFNYFWTHRFGRYFRFRFISMPSIICLPFFFALSRQSCGCNHCFKHYLNFFLAGGVWIRSKENDIAENLATLGNFLSCTDKICKYQRKDGKSHLSSCSNFFAFSKV